MTFELFIAKRYVGSKKKSGLLSLITFIAIAGVVIGVAALLIILSVMNGYEDEVRSRLIGIYGHVKMGTFHERGFDQYKDKLEMLKSKPHVDAVSPYILGKGLIISDFSSTAIQIKGIDQDAGRHLLPVEDLITDGDLALDRQQNDPYIIYGIMVGDELARRLEIKVGDEVIQASLAGITRFGQMPQKMRFRVTAIFSTGLFEFDDATSFISLEAAQLLFNMHEKITGIEIKLDDIDRSETFAAQITDSLGYPYRALTWADLNANLFAWYKIQKWAGFIILSLIIMVAAFNIVSTLIMVSMEKTRDIGILKSLGATSKSIRRIFVYDGMFVGFIGTATGLLVGYILCWVQGEYHFLSLPADVYIIGWLPIMVRWSDVLLISAVSMVITLVASVYPASKAAQMDPINAIRTE
ncbi:ABC transporter permease [candidate division KSB1 bacterium]|nr:ABC transporter permease [candidate division KSB1 bacterium]